jgi:hypothetical protein
MRGGGGQRCNPVEAALARLAGLAGRGVTPSRMAREVEVLLASWRDGDRPAAPDEVAERLATMHEQLAAGASAAAEQLGDLDGDEPAAVRHATLVHASLAAAVEAVMQAQRVQHPALPQSTLPGPGSSSARASDAPSINGAAIAGQPLRGAGQGITIEVQWVDSPVPAQSRTSGTGAEASRRKTTNARGGAGKASAGPLL